MSLPRATRDFDYVIIGAGSSGCVLAGRLAQANAGSIAVIEAGGRRWPKFTAIPAAVVRTIGNPRYDWMYRSEPDPSRNGRSELWPRGKGPGGSSLINGMIFVRGNAVDYDAWEAAGATGWSHAGVLPYFTSMESSEYSSPGRGQTGPQHVSKQRYRFALTQPFIDAAQAVGIPFNRDINGPVQYGVGHVQVIQKNGRREDAYDSFLAPAVRAGKVALIEHARAERIMFDGRRACAVLVQRDGKLETITARKRVVLSAGAINSPQLLMLSGVGPAAMLREHGIEVLQDAPEVGKNLMEHPAVWMRIEVDTPTLNQEATPMRMAAAMLRWFAGHGPATASTAQAVGFIDTLGSQNRPDLQIHFMPLSIERGPHGARLPPRRMMGLVPSVNRPESRGSIVLRSNHPAEAPLINPLLLSARADLDALARGVRLCERILAAAPLAQHVIARDNQPPAEDGAAMDEYLRNMAAPAYHPVGTCRMGSDARAVVDPMLRVRGLQGLAVVDASIMPVHVSGNTHAASMMIGEKAASLFKNETD
jgi:choline dehydrogenase